MLRFVHNSIVLSLQWNACSDGGAASLSSETLSLSVLYDCITDGRPVLRDVIPYLVRFTRMLFVRCVRLETLALTIPETVINTYHCITYMLYMECSEH